MDFNILIGGSAGQGVDTVTDLLTLTLKRTGYYVFSTADYMSRVRGGHNFFQVRFSDQPVNSHRDAIDLMFALDNDTVENHFDRLSEAGWAFIDDKIECKRTIRKFPFLDIAKELGNERVANTVGLGLILHFLGIPMTIGYQVIEERFKAEIAEMNKKALERGYQLLEDDVVELEMKEDDKILIDGNQACALGALAAGCRYYCGYPMTPSSSILDYMSKVSKEVEVVVDQVEDEVAALNMALGASYAGARAMTGSSGGGFALMGEAMSMAGIIETPVVVIDVQRPGPATGLPTRTEQADLRFVLHSGHGEFERIVLAFRNAEDAFEQTVRAFNLADKYQVPVILLSDQYLADTKLGISPFDYSKVSIERNLAKPEDYKPGEYRRYQITESGVSPRLIPGQSVGNIVSVDSDEHNERGRIIEDAKTRIEQVDKRARKEIGIRSEMQEPWRFGSENPKTLVVTWGSLQGPVYEAVNELNQEGYEIVYLSYGDIWPLNVDLLKKMAEETDQLIVIEQNATGQFEGLIRQEALIRADHRILKYDGRQFSKDEIIERLKEVL